MTRWYDPADPDAAYDGCTAPPVAALTARERDVLVRVLTFVVNDPRYRAEDVDTLHVIRMAVDPRTRDVTERRSIRAWVAESRTRLRARDAAR